MKEFVYEKPGGVEVIKRIEKDMPKSEPRKVIVKASFGSVNHVDIWGRMDLPGQPFPRVFGSDLSGYIDDPSDSIFKKGDKVVLYPMKFCGFCKNCLAGYENSCFYRAIYGVHVDGFFAEYVSVEAKNVLKLPENVSLEYAAALPVAYTTAYHGLINRSKSEPGSTLLILGGSGGAGVAALQIAKAVGLRVITTTSYDWKAEMLKKLGADEVLKPDDKLLENIFKLTDNNGVDAVFDALGGSYTSLALKAVRKGGRVINMAMTTGSEIQLNLRQIYANNVDLQGVYLGTRKDLSDLLNMVSQGKIKPLIDSVFPIDDVDKAQLRMEKRNHIGKILLKF
ncbi:MAG: zinc-binding dehydrogenase [Nitrososphaeria archaeon]